MGDPCQFVPDAKRGDGERQVIDYESLCESFGYRDFDTETINIMGRELKRMIPREPKQAVPVPVGGNNTAGCAVRVGCDGFCHVYVESDKAGVRRLVIEVGMVNP